MRKLLLFLALIFSAQAVHAQGYDYRNIALNGAGQPLAGVSVAVCAPVATTSANVTNNIATLTISGSSPATQGFAVGGLLTVSGFTGGDTVFNGSFTVLGLTNTQVIYTLQTGNKTAGTNGTVLQQGTNITMSCGGLLPIFTDYAMQTPEANPLVTDGLGNYSFTVVPGVIYIQTYGPSVQIKFTQETPPCVVNSSCGGGGGPITFNAPAGLVVTGSPGSDITLGMPMSWTTGDLLIGNGAGSVARLGVGTNGDQLTVVAGLPAWVTPSPDDRVCMMNYGNQNSGVPMVTGDVQPQFGQCAVAQTGTISSVVAMVDTGASTVRIGYDASAPITGVLTPTTVGGIPYPVVCANVGGTAQIIKGVSVTCGTLTSTTAIAGDYFETIGGAADGTSEAMSIAVIFSQPGGGGGGGSGSCGTLGVGEILFGTGVATCATSSNLTWNNSQQLLSVNGVVSIAGNTTTAALSSNNILFQSHYVQLTDEQGQAIEAFTTVDPSDSSHPAIVTAFGDDLDYAGSGGADRLFANQSGIGLVSGASGHVGTISDYYAFAPQDMGSTVMTDVMAGLTVEDMGQITASANYGIHILAQTAPSKPIVIDAGGGETDLQSTVIAAGQGLACVEGSLPSAITGKDILACDSSTHTMKLSNNGGGFGSIVAGTVSVPQGGTGQTSLTAHGVVIGEGTSGVNVTTAGTAAQCLTSNGASADPTFQNCGGAASTALSGITAATGASTIGNGDNNIRFNWNLSTSSGTGFYIGESGASTAATAPLFRVSTLSTSTLFPVQFDNNGNGVRMSATGILGPLGTGGYSWSGLTSIPTICTNQFVKAPTASTLGCASVNLTSDVTGVLPIANGGTNTSNAPVKRLLIRVAGCNGSTAAPSFDLPLSGGMAYNCKTDATNGTVQGVMAAAQSTVAYATLVLPDDWASFKSAKILFTTADATSGHTIIFTISTACVAPNAGNTDTPAYNAANAFTTTTIGGGATANALYSTTAGTVTNTGCAAGDILHVKLARTNTDTSTDTAIALTGDLVLAYNGTYQ